MLSSKLTAPNSSIETLQRKFINYGVSGSRIQPSNMNSRGIIAVSATMESNYDSMLADNINCFLVVVLMRRHMQITVRSFPNALK